MDNNIAYIYSELFYENSLIAMATPGALNGVLPSEPLSFYGIQGQESKDKLSFSYENFVEAREVCYTSHSNSRRTFTLWLYHIW